MSKLKQTKGFTLIELVIVLAIAALIIAAVLIAVGGAQRSQRDSATKSAAARVASALENFAGNNNGAMPLVGASPGANYLTNITDGAGGTPTNSPIGTTASNVANHEIVYSGNALCANGNGVAGAIANAHGATTATTRSYAVDYFVENGATNVCLDNE